MHVSQHRSQQPTACGILQGTCCCLKRHNWCIGSVPPLHTCQQHQHWYLLSASDGHGLSAAEQLALQAARTAATRTGAGDVTQTMVCCRASARELHHCAYAGRQLTARSCRAQHLLQPGHCPAVFSHVRFATSCPELNLPYRQHRCLMLRS